jgi:putative redox protein
MVRITATYQGDLRCEAVHGPSGRSLTTDAPVDNHGKGETFSPTDLVATALGTCMATIMGLYADREGIDLDGMTVQIDKEMTTTTPRRIARLTVAFRMPSGIDAKGRAALAACADRCPVKLSLHPDIEVSMRFEYAD